MDNKVKIKIEQNRNGRKYDIPKDVIDKYLSKPAEDRTVTLGFGNMEHKPCAGIFSDVAHTLGIGVASGFIDIDQHLFVDIDLDTNLPDYKTFAKLCEAGNTFGFGIRGVGECLEDGTFVMNDIKGVSVMPCPGKEQE